MLIQPPDLKSCVSKHGRHIQVWNKSGKPMSLMRNHLMSSHVGWIFSFSSNKIFFTDKWPSKSTYLSFLNSHKYLQKNSLELNIWFIHCFYFSSSAQVFMARPSFCRTWRSMYSNFWRSALGGTEWLNRWEMVTRATQQKDATQKIRLFQTERSFKKHLKLERETWNTKNGNYPTTI